MALRTQHPFACSPNLDPHTEAAIYAQLDVVSTLVQQRRQCCTVLSELRDALADETAAWLPHIHTEIRAIVGCRMVPFCREVPCITNGRGLQLWAGYVNGLPMKGWACPSLALPAKLTTPSASLRSVVEVDLAHNSKILSSVKSYGDAELDAASWKKSNKEFEVQTLLGPFLPEALPDGVRLFPPPPNMGALWWQRGAIVQKHRRLFGWRAKRSGWTHRRSSPMYGRHPGCWLPPCI